MGLAIFVSGSYFAPAISMMQNAVSDENSGNIVASYGFVTTIAQTLAPIIFGAVANVIDVRKNPSYFGPLISLGICVPYMISSIFYWRAGNRYVKYCKENEHKEA